MFWILKCQGLYFKPLENHRNIDPRQPMIFERVRPLRKNTYREKYKDRSQHMCQCFLCAIVTRSTTLVLRSLNRESYGSETCARSNRGRGFAWEVIRQELEGRRQDWEGRGQVWVGWRQGWDGKGQDWEGRVRSGKVEGRAGKAGGSSGKAEGRCGKPEGRSGKAEGRTWKAGGEAEEGRG